VLHRIYTDLQSRPMPLSADVIMNALGAALGAWVVVPTRIENESPAITAQVATRSL